MSDATWIPLFVTADLTVEVINSVLKAAVEETFEDGDLVGNRWALIQHPDQEPVSTPTNGPVSAFENRFLGASIEQIQGFVKKRFGENAHSSESDDASELLDFVANDSFAVIDERTAKDNSVRFFAEDFVGPAQEAQVRVAWGNATELDHAWDRFTDREASDEDVVLLMNSIEGTDPKVDINEARRKLNRLVSARVDDSEMKWAEFRLRVDTAMQLTYGIAERGALMSLMDREEDFDENGVMFVQ